MVVSLVKGLRTILREQGLNELAKLIKAEDMKPVTINQLVDQFGLDVLTGTAKEDLLIDEDNLLKEFTSLALPFNYVLLKKKDEPDFSEDHLVSLLTDFVVKQEEISNNYSSLFKESINVGHYLANKYEQQEFGIFAIKGKEGNYYIFFPKLPQPLTQKELDHYKKALYADQEYTPQEIEAIKQEGLALHNVYLKNKNFFNELLKVYQDRVLVDPTARSIFKLVAQAQLLLDN